MRRPKAIICDIDGCLLDTRAVLEEAEKAHTQTTATKLVLIGLWAKY